MKKSDATRRIEHWPLSELKKANRNPKRHKLDDLHKSIDRFGFVEPIVVDERTGRLVAGHGRAEALQQLRAGGLPPPAGVMVEGKRWLVPVVRGWSSKDDAQADAYLIASNRIGELGGWDEKELAGLLGDLSKAGVDGAELVGTGYEVDDVAQLLLGLEHQDDPPAEPPPPEPVKVPWVEFGQLFQLGTHRLLVGDSTRRDQVDRLLAGQQINMQLSDPPYATFGSSTGIGADITDDAMIRPFFESILGLCYDLLPWFGHCYLCCDWKSYPGLWEAAKRRSMTPKNKLVWDKGGSGLGSMYSNTYEEIFFTAKEPPARAMKADQITGARLIHRPNVLRHPRPHGEERLHNAAKPVALLRDLVTASSDPGGIVLDLFGGSGSVLIACEQEGRACLTMEKEPKWAQVTIERWEKLTGQRHQVLG